MTFHSSCNGSFGQDQVPRTRYLVLGTFRRVGQGQVALQDRPKFQRSPPSTGGAALAEGLCAKVAPENLRRQHGDLCHLFGLFDPL